MNNIPSELTQSLLADIQQQCEFIPADLLKNISSEVPNDALISSSIQTGNKEICFFSNEIVIEKRADYKYEITDIPDGVWTTVGKKKNLTNSLPVTHYQHTIKKKVDSDQIVMSSTIFSSGNIQYTRRIIENKNTIDASLNISSSGSGHSLIQSNSQTPILIRSKTLEKLGEIKLLPQKNLGNYILSSPCFNHSNENCYFSAIDIQGNPKLRLIEWNVQSGESSSWEIRRKAETSLEDISSKIIKNPSMPIHASYSQKVFLTVNWVIIVLFSNNPALRTLLYHIPKSDLNNSSYTSDGDLSIEASVIDIQLPGQIVDIAVDYEDKGSNVHYAFVLLDSFKCIVKHFVFDPPNPKEIQLVSEKQLDAPAGIGACIFNSPINVENSLFYSPGFNNTNQHSCLFISPSNNYTFPTQTNISGLTVVTSSSANTNFLLLCCTFVEAGKEKIVRTQIQIFDCSDLKSGPAFIVRTYVDESFDFGESVYKGSWDSAV